MVSDRDFIFHMCVPCGKTFSLVPRSRSFVKVEVKYQDHICQKMAITRALVFLIHSLFLYMNGNNCYTFNPFHTMTPFDRSWKEAF